MRIWGRSSRVWDGYTALSFSVSACFVCWAFSLAATFGPGFDITIHPLRFTIQTGSILMMASAFLPACYCFVTYPECRSSVWKVNASWKVYAAAFASGLCLPFTSYLGTHNPAFPWGSLVAVRLAGAFGKNLVVSPFWEEIVWRGCILNKIRPLASTQSAILLTSLGWTVWHGGYFAFYYSRGYPTDTLILFVFIVFFTGILFGSLFELGHGSVWPSVVAHSAFHAAMDVYYTDYNRTSELGSYVAELIFVAVAAAIMFRVAIRKSRLSAGAAHSG